MFWSLIAICVPSRALRRILFPEPWGALTGRWIILINIFFPALNNGKKKRKAQTFLDSTSYNQQNQGRMRKGEPSRTMTIRVHTKKKIQESMIQRTSQYHIIVATQTLSKLPIPGSCMHSTKHNEQRQD